MRSFFSRLVSLFLTFTLLALPVSASQTTVDDLTASTENSFLLNSYESAGFLVSYLSYYQQVNPGTEFYLPDYYAGNYIDYAGHLVILLTDTSSELISTIRTICDDSTNSIRFQIASNSFNDLYRTKSMIRTLCETKQLTNECYIDMIDNCVRVDESLYRYIANYEPETANIQASLLFSTVKSVTTISENNRMLAQRYADVESHYISEASSSLDSDIQPRSASSISVRPGNDFSFSSYGVTRHGSVGYCAIDDDNRRLMVTHGHDLSDGTSIYMDSTYIGTVLYADNTDVDFSVVELNDSSLLSNRLGSSPYHMTGCVNSSYELENYSTGYNFYFRGAASGGERIIGAGSSSRTVIDPDHMIYCIESIHSPSNGDSGGPVYLKYNTSSGINYLLVGIVEGYIDSSTGEGISGMPCWLISRHFYTEFGCDIMAYTSNTEA